MPKPLREIEKFTGKQTYQKLLETCPEFSKFADMFPFDPTYRYNKHACVEQKRNKYRYAIVSKFLRYRVRHHGGDGQAILTAALEQQT